MNNFKKRRLELELTQYEIERKTGISQSKLSLAERGFRSLSSDEKRELSKVLQMQEKKLFSDSQ